MPADTLSFKYAIETHAVRFGKWVYVIHLSENKSRPSRKFATQEAALREAKELLSYMR